MNRDNQQETVENICWLAGAFDADGTISIRDTVNRTPNPYFDISNTDDSFIDKTVKIIKTFGINPYISEQKMNKKWKKVYRVRVHKREQIKILLNALMPFLTAKKARASLVINYIENQERNIVDEVKLLNKRGTTDSSETTRETPIRAMI